MEKHVVGLATQVLVMAIVISVILLFLGIGVLVLIHVCIVGRTMRSEVGERNRNMVERGSLGSTSMSQDDIEKLPCFDFAAKARGSSPAADCAVCLENFKVGERCRLLPSCNHSFHAECVDLWLLRTPICPICRAAAADLLSIGSLYEEEGGEREGAAGDGDERESGSNADGQLGINLSVEVLDTHHSTHTQTREAMINSSERVTEVRERQED